MVPGTTCTTRIDMVMIEQLEELDILKNLDDVIENMEHKKKIRILLTSDELQK